MAGAHQLATAPNRRTVARNTTGKLQTNDSSKMKSLFTVILTSAFLVSFGQATWKSLDDFPKKWIKVERDSLGYLVYDPCNGGTPMITIDSGYVTIYWQLDSPNSLVINKFIRLVGNRSFYMNAADKGVNCEFTVEVKNDTQKLILWSFDDFKWVMTPYENKSEFRQVNNPCLTEMKTEKQFLPVEF